MHIDGPTSGKLRQAMLSAFDGPDDLGLMLKDYLDVRLARISLKPNFDNVVDDVISYYNRRYEISTLVAKARLSNPTNLQLRAFQEKYIFGVSLPTGARDYVELSTNFQLMVSPIDKVDPAQWRMKMAQHESRVCQVILPDGAGTGTGFLVGPDLVITNYHVIKPLMNKLDQLHTLTLRFDYALLSDGRPNAGVDYQAAELIEYSEYSVADTDPTGVRVAEADKLDFALLRVQGRPGDDKPGTANQGSDTDSKRGWIKPPTVAPDLNKPTIISILQHPDGQPLKLALPTSHQVNLNATGTRVRYSTNTDGGSSGSPCFDHRWNLVALHHLGDPDYTGIGLAAYNQGIPFTAITDLLAKTGKLDLLGK